MRKLRLLSLLLLAISFIAINCTKEGPEGPVGATGPQGPPGTGGTTGPTGPAGSANVIYSAWFTLTGWHDSTLADQGLTKVDYRDAPGISATIISNGVVLSYSAPSAASTFNNPLPWLVTSVNPNIILSYIPSVGRMIYYNKQVNSAAGGIVLNAAYVYRYVIIPGGVAGGRSIDGQAIMLYNGYTLEELKAMPYEQVATLFNIPSTGSNQ